MIRRIDAYLFAELVKAFSYRFTEGQDSKNFLSSLNKSLFYLSQGANAMATHRVKGWASRSNDQGANHFIDLSSIELLMITLPFKQWKTLPEILSPFLTLKNDDVFSNLTNILKTVSLAEPSKYDKPSDDERIFNFFADKRKTYNILPINQVGIQETILLTPHRFYEDLGINEVIDLAREFEQTFGKRSAHQTDEDLCLALIKQPKWAVPGWQAKALYLSFFEKPLELINSLGVSLKEEPELINFLTHHQIKESVECDFQSPSKKSKSVKKI